MHQFCYQAQYFINIIALIEANILKLVRFEGKIHNFYFYGVYSDHLEPERHSLSIHPSISFFHIEEIQSYTAVHWASHAWVTLLQ